MARIRRYSELILRETFEERFEYLNLKGRVGQATFGYDRWMNQRFYSSREWQDVRDYVIVRDNGCDLGVPGHEIHLNLLVHHMNPITVEGFKVFENWMLDPEYLITTSLRTHNAIHYGNRNLLPSPVVARAPGDTKLW